MLASEHATVLDALGDATIVSDAEDRIVHVNPAAERLTGWPAHELLDRSVVVLIPDRWRDRHEQGFRRYAATRTPTIMGRPVRVPLLRRDGDEIDIELTLAPFPGELVIASMRDLRDRIELERQGELLALVETLLASAPVGIGFLDRDLRYVRVNEVLAATNGLSARDHVGRTLREVVPDLADALEPIYRHVLEVGEASVNREISGAAPAGGGLRRHWLVSHYPVRGRDGGIVGVGVVTVDVSERKWAEEEQRRSERLRKAITDNATVGLFLMDGRHHCTFMNPAAEQITGFSFDEVRARDVPLHYVIHHTRPDGRPYPMQECPLDRALPARNQERGEDVFVRPDGSFYDVAFTASPLVEDGRAVGTVIEIREITEEKRARTRQRLLIEASERLAGSIDYDQTLAAVAELAVPALCDGCIVLVAEDAAPARRVAVAHADPEKVRLLDELWARYPLDPDAPQGATHVIRTGEPELHPEITDQGLRAAARDDGHRRLLSALRLRSALIVPMKARGRVLGAITMIHDASERRFTREDLPFAMELARRAAVAVDNARLFEDAQAAIRARDEFLSIAAHELRTPLVPLRLHLEMIARLVGEAVDDRLAARVRAKLDTALRATDRLTGLVEGVLDVSRVTSGRLALAREPTRLAELVHEVADRFAAAAAAAGASIRVHAPDDVIGSWDRARIDQVITNLVSNAVKYGAGGAIDVAVATRDRRAVITVRDRGIGISTEDQARIFDRFERAVPSRHYGGLGLGLYVSRQIVEAHGGRLTVASRPGEGATFTVELPLDPPAMVDPADGRRSGG